MKLSRETETQEIRVNVGDNGSFSFFHIEQTHTFLSLCNRVYASTASPIIREIFHYEYH